jgi:NAD(P)-dependent dehydrogenase (short-subunit alcohol dehydrogenase family)
MLPLRAGIGAAIVRRFSSAGCRVVIADIDEHAAHALAKELGNDAVAMHCDVTCASVLV